MHTGALAQSKPPRCQLKSISQTSTRDSSLFTLDFYYDPTGRLSEKIVTTVNSEYPNSSYYNYTLKINFEYSEDMLTTLLHGREYSTFSLKNGTIHIKEFSRWQKLIFVSYMIDF